MTLVRVDEKTVLQMPDFIHDFGHYPDSENPLLHEGIIYRNHVPVNFVRHRTVEKMLYKLRSWLLELDAMPSCSWPLYTFFHAILTLSFGLNCKFPLKDVALYIFWEVRGCKPVAVFKRSRGHAST